MPSVTKKQHGFMAKVATDPKFAREKGINQSVGEEFMRADKGRKFGKGGEAHSEKGEMKKDLAQDKKMIKKAIGMHDKQEHPGKKTDLSKLRKGGKACMSSGGRAMSKGEHPVQTKSKRGAEMIKMAGGGFVRAADGVATKGKTKAKQVRMCGGGKM